MSNDHSSFVGTTVRRLNEEKEIDLHKTYYNTNCTKIWRPSISFMGTYPVVLLGSVIKYGYFNQKRYRYPSHL